jgi:5-methyltetrahydrofolate--homocysteine methyltransferase
MTSKQLVTAIVNLREEESVSITNDLLEQGIEPLGILGDCRAAMAVIGGRFEREEAFLPELIMAGEILKAISELIKLCK